MNDGSHDGDEISQMSNSELVLYFFLKLNNNLKNTIDFNEQLDEEMINELDYRIRSYSLDIEENNILSLIFNLQSPIIFNAIFDLGSEYASSLIEKSLFNQEIDKSKSIQFLQDYMNYYKKSVHGSQSAFDDIFKTLQGTAYENEIVSHLEDYIITNPSIALQTQYSNFITQDVVINFLRKTKSQNYFDNESFKKSSEFLISKLEYQSFEKFTDIDLIIVKNRHVMSQFKNLISENHIFFSRRNFKNFLNILKKHKLDHKELFNFLPENLKQNIDYMEIFFTTIKDAPPQYIPVKFLNDFDFSLSLLIQNNKNDYIDYFFKAMDDDKKENFLIYLVESFDYMYKNKIKKFKEIYPKIHLDESDLLSMENNAYKYLENLSQYISKYLIKSDKKDDILITIFDAMYLNLNGKKNQNATFNFFIDNNLQSLYENNKNTGINFLALNLMSDNPNINYQSLEKLIKNQIKCLYEKYKNHKNCSTHILNYVQKYIHPTNKIEDRIFIDTLKVLPLEIINTLQQKNLFSPSIYYTIVNNKGNRVIDQEFYSNLSIAALEYSLEESIPTNNITTKKIKF